MPATARIPPRTSDHSSNDPRRWEPRGRPAAIQACTSTSTARTSEARFAAIQPFSGTCLKFFRSHARSIFGSMRMRTARRAISIEKRGLLPVSSHIALLGRRSVRDWPSSRSDQICALSADAPVGVVVVAHRVPLC